MTNTLFTGKVYYRFDELPSTNDRALEMLAKSKPPEGTVLRADTQTAGRGQFGSRWESEPGANLLLSIIYYPSWLAVDRQFYLGMAAALSLHDLIGSFGECCVKWPNDLYLGDRKTAGILIQNSIGGNAIQSSVIGIGLNVNQLRFDPALPNPTSLAAAFGRSFDPEMLLPELLARLESRYLQLKSGRYETLKADYENALYRRGLLTRFQDSAADVWFQGTILGVAESGLLRVDIPEAGVRTFGLKEIRLDV